MNLGLNFAGRCFVVDSSDQDIDGEKFKRVRLTGAEGTFETWLDSKRIDLAPPAGTIVDCSGQLRMKSTRNGAVMKLFLEHCVLVAKMSPINGDMAATGTGSAGTGSAQSRGKTAATAVV